MISIQATWVRVVYGETDAKKFPSEYKVPCYLICDGIIVDHTIVHKRVSHTIRMSTVFIMNNVVE